MISADSQSGGQCRTVVNTYNGQTAQDCMHMLI